MSETLALFPPLKPEARAILDGLLVDIDEAAPMPLRKRPGLPTRIRELWAELTSERAERRTDYLSSPEKLSAYLRYFLPWNLYRYIRLFEGLSLGLPEKPVIVDLGSGPLTALIGLWIARPELRERPALAYCIDRSGQAMETGAAILNSLVLRATGKLCPWKIVRIKDGIGARVREKADLVLAGYVLNEIYSKNRIPLEEVARKSRVAVSSYAKSGGKLMVMEPGTPDSGAFLSALRKILIDSGASILAPCPHEESCPMPGRYRQESAGPLPSFAVRGRGKKPWCHFNFQVDFAPYWLSKLSRDAGLPKESASMSFLFADLSGKAGEFQETATEAAGTGTVNAVSLRIVSEAFPLPGGAQAQYACSSLGYTLVSYSAARAEDLWPPGSFIRVKRPKKPDIDEKSGACVIHIDPPPS